MKVVNTLTPCLFAIVIIVVSSCAKEPNLLDLTLNYAYTFHQESITKFNKDVEQFVKEFEAYKMLYKSYKTKEDTFFNSLSNDELKAYSEVIEAYKNNNTPNLIIAKRKYLNLLEQHRTKNELYIFNNLLKEGAQVDMKYAELHIKAKELDKRQKEIRERSAAYSELERKREEDVKRREMLSAVKGISSSIDSMRFDLEQYRMQRFLGIR
jgi:hypothetical protein